MGSVPTENGPYFIRGLCLKSLVKFMEREENLPAARFFPYLIRM